MPKENAMGLQIFNVLGREKQEFRPIHAGRVGMYVCGPTVYDHSHLGHAKTYVFFDVLVRHLRASGLEVLYIQNITDVGHMLESGEDRILRKANQLQAKPMQIVETYARSYFSDMDALGVGRPDISPRAGGHIPEQIQMIQTLLAKGFAYESNGSVYFDVSRDSDYGKLSNRRVEELEAGAREEVREDKRQAEDFALWKRAEPHHILRWESPWGEGFPGWHIECSAMARKYLGDTFDIHGGGVDNIFPHNECEIAQSESANDAPFANYWMLTGSLTVDGVKMSKSLGNFRTIKDALAEHKPEVIRTFLLGAHYRGPVDYSSEALYAAGSGWERLNNAARLARHQTAHAPTSDDGNAFLAVVTTTRAQFNEAMDDDFNTPRAIAVLQDFTREVNTLLNSGTTVGAAVLAEINSVYAKQGGEILGLINLDAQSGDSQREAGLIELLIDLRKRARVGKNYAEADRIRQELANLGVQLDDRADGTVWRVN
jgi:cysteinyl-tRNA synthetase